MRADIKQLMRGFGEIFKSLHQYSYQKMENCSLYPGQHKLLSLIKANEGCTQKELSGKNFVKPATITGMINKLEANHYVYRVIDETDKRIMRVYLTSEGRHLADQADLFIEDLTDVLVQDFSEEELETFIYYIEKVRNNLNNAIK